MPRQARLDYPGTLHHVIFRGVEKRKIVNDDVDRRDLVNRLGDLAKETGTTVYAWSLMGNHAHILLRSGLAGLSNFMRRFLTGYVSSYNRRHRRHGTLFQNRYKSIVCEEESYFLELVRYIHLNPLRAKLVRTLSELDKYRYSGHAVLMGRIKYNWQDCDEVLGHFGGKELVARKSYRGFIKAGVKQGRKPNLVGGGLLRSQGGWSNVVSRRRQGLVDLADARILGSGEFVECVIAEAKQQVKQKFSKRKIVEVVRSICKKEGIKVSELKGGGRRGKLSSVRLQISRQLVQEHGVPMVLVAREVGVTTAAISRSLSRAVRNKQTSQ